jgi:hypothetical protein
MNQIAIGCEHVDVSTFVKGKNWSAVVPVSQHPERTEPMKFFVDSGDGRCVNALLIQNGFVPGDEMMVDNTTYQAQLRDGVMFLILVNNGPLPMVDQFTKH